MAESSGEERGHQCDPGFPEPSCPGDHHTPYAIVLGMVYNFLPFMVLPIYNVLAKIDNVMS